MVGPKVDNSPPKESDQFTSDEKDQDNGPPPKDLKTATLDQPVGDERTNILFHQTPLPTFDNIAIHFTETILFTSIIIALISFVAQMLISDAIFSSVVLSGIIGGITFAGLSVILSTTAVQLKSSNKHPSDDKTPKERLPLVPESVEWMNNLISTIWSTVDQKMLKDISTQVETQVAAFLPAGIVQFGLPVINLGENAMRVTSMRALPDEEMGEMAPVNIKSTDADDQAAKEKRLEEEEGGVFYNLEVGFAYHGSPGYKDVGDRTRNIHVQLAFIVTGVKIPITVEVRELSGTIRIRLQLTRALPFLKTVSFAFMAPPKVGIYVKPIAGGNILDFPVIDNAIKFAISHFTTAFTFPKSMPIDLGIVGSDIRDSTNATGVLFVKIHRAIGLPKGDTRGNGDPYITVSFSHYEKLMYATRIIENELNPVFEEAAAILVFPENVKAKESVAIKLWDSDKTTADDVSGQVEFSLHELIMNEKQMFKRRDKIMGEIQGTEGQGELEWEVGYFPRREFEQPKKVIEADKKIEAGKEDGKETDPQALKAQRKAPEPNTAANTPPSQEFFSGILSVTVSQIANLAVPDPKGEEHRKKQQKEDPDGEPEGYLPSSYANVILNDQVIYRTRVKAITQNPIYNSYTEQFLRDWRSAIVTVGVYDQKKKDDELLGLVYFKLSDVFSKSSQAAGWYSLEGGSSTGKVRIALLFRSVDLKLEPKYVGWQVGTFEFLSDTIVAKSLEGHKLSGSKLKARTGGSKRSVKGGKSSGDSITWSFDDGSLRLPVLYRHVAPIVFEFHAPLQRKATATALLWLPQLIDEEEKDYSIPVYTTNEPKRLLLNYIDESNKGDFNLTQVGTLEFRGKYSPGVDDDHNKFADTEDTEDVMEAYEVSKKLGFRKGIYEDGTRKRRPSDSSSDSEESQEQAKA